MGYIKSHYRVFFLIFFILLIIFTVSFSASYAIFQKEIVAKNFTIIVEELTYSVESAELHNGSITIPAGVHKNIDIKITSQNQINSKYELYYNGNDLSGVEIGYYTNTADAVAGLIQMNESKIVSLKVVNDSDVSKTVTFGVEGGLDYNELELTKGMRITKEFEPLYKDEILKGCDPVLGDHLVPVTIDNNGIVRKADITESWYDYGNKIWANAVVLEEGAKEYEICEIIKETDIESYFVWIPRYKYKIFDTGNYTGSTSINSNAPQTIEIEFESKDIELSNGTAKNQWLTHPAFRSFDTNGFWVGKFDSGYSEATSPSGAEVDVADATRLVIKPNTYSWRNINVGNAFKTGYEYLRSSESHMMKNTEWGAVAYLSHSNYGISTEIYINNNSSYLTGCGGDTASASSISSCANAYGSKSDGIYHQTTTGNISGVFDLSGGAWEYVMGIAINAMSDKDSSTISSLYPNFFNNSEWDIYYDKYTSDAFSAYHNRILGDATGEMGPFKDNYSSWYNDSSRFVFSSFPWFCRGGYYNDALTAGVFSFDYGTGGAFADVSFRVVVLF